MNRTLILYLVAWIVVPAAFALYVTLAYSWSLAKGSLPFLGTHEVRWWIAFISALFVGGICVVSAQRRGGIGQVLWPAVYVVVMAAVLLGAHLTVACIHGDCL